MKVGKIGMGQGKIPMEIEEGKVHNGKTKCGKNLIGCAILKGK